VVEQQRVAVRRRTRHLGGADRAAGARHVVDHDAGAAQRLAQRLGKVARHAVGRAAGGERNDHGDGLGTREVLGMDASDSRGDRHEGEQFLHDLSEMGMESALGTGDLIG